MADDDLDPGQLPGFDGATALAEFEAAADKYNAAIDALQEVFTSGILEPIPAANTVLELGLKELLNAGQTKHQLAALLRRIARDL